MIKKQFNIICTLIPGSNGIYDIIVDKKTIFSKDQTKRFPDNNEIIQLIKNKF